MKIFPWQRGLHLEPENQEEREALWILTKDLKVMVGDKVIIAPVVGVDRDNEESIVPVDTGA